MSRAGNENFGFIIFPFLIDKQSEFVKNKDGEQSPLKATYNGRRLSLALERGALPMGYITINDLFSFGILIVSIITLVITIMRKKK